MEKVEYNQPKERPKTFRRINPDTTFCFTHPDFLSCDEPIVEVENTRDPLENSFDSRLMGTVSEILEKY